MPPDDSDLFVKICLLLRLTTLVNREEAEYRNPFQSSTNHIPEENLSDFHSLEAVSAICLINDEVVATTYISNLSEVAEMANDLQTDIDASIEDAEASLELAEADGNAGLSQCSRDLEDSDEDTDVEAFDRSYEDAEPDVAADIDPNTPIIKPADVSEADVSEADVSEADVSEDNVFGPRHNLGHPLQVVIVSNPTSRNQGPSPNLNAHKLRLLDTKTATNFWPDVKKNEWYCVFRNIKLQDHIQTVAAYLNDYKAAADYEKAAFASSFSSYLLTACWRKMHKRVSSWPAVGLISELYSALGSSDTNIFPWEKLRNDQGPGDRMLAHILLDVDANQAIPILMQRVPEEYRSVSQLLAAVKKAVDTKSYYFYNQSTAHQFQCVLVAALIGFASSLQFIQTWKHLNTTEPSPENRKFVKQSFQSVAFHARILTCILASTTFATHMSALMCSGLLRPLLPTLDKAVHYRVFATKHKMGFQLLESKGPPSVSDDYEDPENEDYAERDSPSLTPLIRWIRSFVIHFLAKRTLERHCVKFPDEKVDFPTVAADHPMWTRPPTWEDMQDIVRDTMSLEDYTSDVTPQQVIEKLEQVIKTGKEGRDDKGKVIYSFKRIIRRQELKMSATLHAEMVLMLLGLEQCRDRILINRSDPLRELCVKITQNIKSVSVSRFCCPVCWQFFELLEEEGTGIMPVLQGKHGNIYPVQLPTGLPPNIVTGMVDRFRLHLRHELEFMTKVRIPAPNMAMDIPKGRHRRRPSNTSNANVSVLSSNSLCKFDASATIAAQWTASTELPSITQHDSSKSLNVH